MCSSNMHEKQYIFVAMWREVSKAGRGQRYRHPAAQKRPPSTPVAVVIMNRGASCRLVAYWGYIVHL